MPSAQADGGFARLPRRPAPGALKFNAFAIRVPLIPKESLIKLSIARYEQLQILFFKRLLRVMLFLIADVSPYRGNLRLTNCESSITILPSKLQDRPMLVIKVLG